MKNKKSGFLTFCCSLVPGAGEMYLGLYKQGISLMLLFFGIGAFAAWSGLEVLLAIAPVIWFFSFFHTHNLRNMSEEEFLRQEDRYLFFQGTDFSNADEFFTKNRKIIAAILILLGICMVSQIIMNLLDPFFNSLYWSFVWRLNRNAPRVIVAVAVIFAGVQILKGNLPKEKEITE
ncbi:hypothetical protein CLNEO_20190 [Anaerotignum neopropionicum]|uniref:TM2 domain protein n=1 Tax=Anaerotignum neopropionicum TaxID=36847 RepID=A0A136WDN2_9FIRM|nr:hypothetical protein [Anaerotignum neopropionicum]KXL52610.1 hypothetical protein CLNEO_20190 [Anaerotignum neopropionicum]